MTVRVCGSAQLYLGPNEMLVGSNMTQTPDGIRLPNLGCSQRQEWKVCFLPNSIESTARVAISSLSPIIFAF